MQLEPQVEYHPLKPFLPKNARILMLGSFPPKQERWSMEFYYPNFQNDMWRIMGLLFFNDKSHFVEDNQRCFVREKVVEFCNQKGIALYDTATAIKRLKDNASDKFLEVVESTNIQALIQQLPSCNAIITTGQKATDTITKTLQCQQPPVGGLVELIFDSRPIRFYRMPSSSRAYPLALEKKAAFYKILFIKEQIL